MIDVALLLCFAVVVSVRLSVRQSVALQGFSQQCSEHASMLTVYNIDVSRHGQRREASLSKISQVADHLDGRSAEHEILAIRQRLRRRHDNGISGVDRKRCWNVHT